MFKKLIFFIGFSVLMLIHLDKLYADGNLILPLKKPILTNQELDEKISINILKPLRKPIKNKEIVKTVEIVKENKKKT